MQIFVLFLYFHPAGYIPFERESIKKAFCPLCVLIDNVCVRFCFPRSHVFLQRLIYCWTVSAQSDLVRRCFNVCISSSA